MTKLNKILKKRGIKQKYIAKKLGVSETAVSNWVKGKHIPQPKYILKLAKLLGVSIEELINEKIFSKKERRLKQNKKITKIKNTKNKKVITKKQKAWPV